MRNVSLLALAMACSSRVHDAEPIVEERGVIVNTVSIADFDGQTGQSAHTAK